jgi:hypothetical protein
MKGAQWEMGKVLKEKTAKLLTRDLKAGGKWRLIKPLTGSRLSLQEYLADL